MNTIQKMILILVAVIGLLGSLGPTEAMPIIRDQCNSTSGDGQGHTCPGPNDLLIRPKYEDGKCGDWMCCPPNPDGKTYDCAHATKPTSKINSGGLKKNMAPRATVASPKSSTGTK